MIQYKMKSLSAFVNVLQKRCNPLFGLHLQEKTIAKKYENTYEMKLFKCNRMCTNMITHKQHEYQSMKLQLNIEYLWKKHL